MDQDKFAPSSTLVDSNGLKLKEFSSIIFRNLMEIAR